jgi:hypothetical protein
MSAAKVAPPKTRPPTDDPTVEAQPVRGLLFGLLFAPLLWLLMGALALAGF